MSPPTISLSMMQFESGPLMPGESIDVVAEAKTRVVCSPVAPVETDLVLSMVQESEPVVLNLYAHSEPSRMAG